MEDQAGFACGSGTTFRPPLDLTPTVPPFCFFPTFLLRILLLLSFAGRMTLFGGGK